MHYDAYQTPSLPRPTWNIELVMEHVQQDLNLFSLVTCKAHLLTIPTQAHFSFPSTHIFLMMPLTADTNPWLEMHLIHLLLHLSLISSNIKKRLHMASVFHVGFEICCGTLQGNIARISAWVLAMQSVNMLTSTPMHIITHHKNSVLIKAS